MTTATAPSATGRWTTEILGEPEVRMGHLLMIPYRETSPEGKVGETVYAEVVQPKDSAVMEDRWEGLINDGHDPSKLQNRLDRVLWDIEKAMVRRVQMDTPVYLDGEILDADVVMDLDGLLATIKEWFIERAAKVAR